MLAGRGDMETETQVHVLLTTWLVYREGKGIVCGQVRNDVAANPRPRELLKLDQETVSQLCCRKVAAQ